MKNIVQLFMLLFLIGLKTGYSFSQIEEYDIIKISRISKVSNHEGTITEQLKVDLENNKIYYRKKLYRNFKELHTNINYSLFSDSLKIERVRQISKLISENDEECVYHNEYGYFKIELIKLDRENEIYGEIFLLNVPYKCQDENDQILVRTYYYLIIELFKEL